MRTQQRPGQKTRRLSPFVEELATIVGPQAVLHEPSDLLLYSYDATCTTAQPEYVVLPQTTEQVAAVLRLAQRHGVPVTPRGAGTCLSGGPIPIEGGLVVALTRMDRILEIDVANRRAVVQPGVINADLLSAAQAHGLFYAPDPSSQVACTIGGNVAENSGGPHCLKYGVTTNHVLGLEIVLPDGEVARLGGKAHGMPGYDLVGLITGSEGTFGIVTEITCRLLPMPEAVVTVLAIFDSLEDASEAVSTVIARGLLPATLEMMDRPMIEAVQMVFDAGYPEDAEAVLIVELDGLRVGMDRQVRLIRQVCQEHRARRFQWADTDEERMALWRGRKGAFGAVANLSPTRFCSDVAVPRTELPRVLSAVMEIGARHGLRVGNVFHAGDGNLHPQVLFDSRDPEQVARAQRADEEITQLAVRYGGVLSGEHGIGSCKRKWMPLMFSPADLRAMWAVKGVFDPEGRMNPGKVLPPPEACGLVQTPQLPQKTFLTAARRLVPVDDDLTCHPHDVEAVSKLMAVASREGQRIRVLGGGTKSSERRPHEAVLSTLGLSRLLAVEPDNLTIRAQAGVRWAELQRAAAQFRQWVPLWPPHPDKATVGGVIAADSSGPHRLRYGTCRDTVTGIRFVLPDGSVVNVGSTCVKNVSGYALEKLLIGSHGTLGVITDVTFKMMPRPETRRTLCLRVPGAPNPWWAENLTGFADAAVGGNLLPAAVELLSPGLLLQVATRASLEAHAAGGEWLLALAVEGLTEEVAYMAQRFEELGAQFGMAPGPVVPDPSYEAFWSAVTEVGPPTIELTYPPAHFADAVQIVYSQLGTDVALRVGLGTGVALVALQSAPDGRECEKLVLDLDAECASIGGKARWLSPIPPGTRNPELTGVHSKLCRRIKSAYDPEGILPYL